MKNLNILVTTRGFDPTVIIETEEDTEIVEAAVGEYHDFFLEWDGERILNPTQEDFERVFPYDDNVLEGAEGWDG